MVSRKDDLVVAIKGVDVVDDKGYKYHLGISREAFKVTLDILKDAVLSYEKQGLSGKDVDSVISEIKDIEDALRETEE